MNQKELSERIDDAIKNSGKISEMLASLKNDVTKPIDLGKLNALNNALNKGLKEIIQNYDPRVVKLRKVEELIKKNDSKYECVVSIDNDGAHLMINTKTAVWKKNKHNMYIIINNRNEIYDMIADADEKLIQLVNESVKAVFGREPKMFRPKDGHQ